MKKALKWIGLTVAGLILVVLLLDSFGGYFLDGPLGPIPGGHMSGPVVDPAEPLDWSGVEREIQIEVRPEQPWSLTVWRAFGHDLKLRAAWAIGAGLLAAVTEGLTVIAHGPCLLVELGFPD